MLLRGSLRSQSEVLWALKDVDLRCNEGETIGIIGPNGAGKSTLCLVIANILTPDEGSARVRGKVSALVSLGAGFNSELSGRANIFLYAAYLGIPRSLVSERFEEIVDFAELGDLIEEPVRHYSSGMRARLGFAVATFLEPEILILDEVMSVGDLAFKERSQRRIEQMMARSRSIVIVSHSMALIRGFTSSCVWLEGGRVEMSGPSDDVVSAYEESVKRARS